MNNEIDKLQDIDKRDTDVNKPAIRVNGTRTMLPPFLSGGLLTGFLVVIFIIFMLLVFYHKNQEKSQYRDVESAPVGQVDQAGQNPSIIAGRIDPNLTIVSKQNGNVELTYIVKNQTEKEQELTFKNNVKYDYVLKDPTGNILIQRSLQMDADSTELTQTLEQGEEVNFKISAEQLKKGTYTLEAWLVLKEGNKYTTKKEFSIE